VLAAPSTAVNRWKLLCTSDSFIPSHLCMWRIGQVYWVGVDYLGVAAAALRCSAPFTALMYCEHWCEEAYGRLARPEASLLDEVRW
jgi:hypothetical protein